MAQNFWLYDRDNVVSWYHWEVKTQSIDDELSAMGLLDTPEIPKTGLASEIETDTKNKNVFTRFKETLQKRWKSWWDILTLWVNDDEVGAVETGVKYWFNFLGTLADLWWDFAGALYEDVAPEVFQEKIKEWAEYLAETSWWEAVIWKLLEAQKNLEDLNEFDPVKWQRFQWWLDMVNGLLTVMWVWQAEKAIQNATLGSLKNIKSIPWDIIDKTKEIAWGLSDKVWDIASWFKTAPDDKLLKNLNLETEKGIIWWIEVDVPKIDKTISEKVVDLFPWKTEKELAGRAVSPRTIWKNAKWKLKSVADVEVNTKQFYDNVRIWVLDWDIDTLENAAQTIVNNIDTVWARIWAAVKKVDWTIEIDGKTFADIESALLAKWAEVSPATPILQKLKTSLWDWKLSIDDAYELKKAYQNEVKKLFLSGDAWTKQYKALSDWVKFLNTKIDEIIETKLGTDFSKDKTLFGQLKTLVDDMVASSLVEWRRAPNTLAEQIWLVESIFSPVSAAKMKLIQTVWEQNTRGWAWKQLIKQYDAKSVKNFNTKKWLVWKLEDINLKNVDEKALIIAKELGALDKVKEIKVIITDYIKEFWTWLKDKLWDMLDDIATKISWKIEVKIKDLGWWVIDSKTINTQDIKQTKNLFDTYKKTNTSSNWTIIVDSDNIKRMFTDYNPLKPELVHRQSSDLSQKFYETALKESKNQKVILLAWWWWSGKSEMLVKAIKNGEPAIVFDWTGKDYNKMIKNYELAKSAWKTPSVEALYINFNKAKKFNLARERVVPLDILKWTHQWYRETTLRLLNDRPDIPVTLKVNLWVKVNDKAIWFTIPANRIKEFIKARQKLEN